MRHLELGVVLLFVWIAASACSSAPPTGSLSARPAVAVPKQVLLSTVTDSEVFRPANLGVLYRYGPRGVGPDVYVYPSSTWPDPATQARLFIETLEIEKRRRVFDSYTVLLNMPFDVQHGGATVTGHEVIHRFTRSGNQYLSYFAVVPLEDRYIKFRISRLASSPDTVRRGFVAAWLDAYSVNR